MSPQPARSSIGLHTSFCRLSGPSEALDPRTHAFREDLADLGLAGRVVASHYADPVLERCVVERAPMRARPDAAATAVSELLYGESFSIVERRGDWLWGYACHDRYVGYVPARAIGPAPAATHRVNVPQALVFTAPDIKSPLRATLALGAEIAAEAPVDGSKFYALHDGGFIHARHVGGLTPGHHDPVALAKLYLGTPYLWGGRTRAGIDCSGLIQTVFSACGHVTPRDSDQQRDQMGVAVDPSKIEAGDLVFFPGHVGLMATGTELLHANAYWMTTVIEPLKDVVDRLRPDHDLQITAVRRVERRASSGS